MAFKKDCIYYNDAPRPQQYRADCDKLQKVIKPKDCNGCGWYEMIKKHQEKRGLEGKL